MKTAAGITGRAYSGDSRYDNLHGRVVAKYITPIGVTDDGHVIARVTRYIDIGRSDPVAPGDFDALLADERWENERGAPTEAWQAWRSSAEEKHAALQEIVVRYLMEHGPSSLQRLAREVFHYGYKKQYLRNHLGMRRGQVYVSLRMVQGAARSAWGLVGIHDTEGE